MTSTAPSGVPWLVLSAGDPPAPPEPPLRSRRVYLQVVALTLVVLVVVGFLGSAAARRVAEREAVNDAAQRAGILADAVVEPALLDSVVDGDPAAITRLDEAVRSNMLGASIVRVKFWLPDGTIVYSDESRLVGRTFDLGPDERAVLKDPATRAEVTDLDEPENEYERGQGKLLEVYRPVTTPDGHRLLFETYAPYDVVLARSGDIWRGFAGITVSSLIGLLVLMLPVLWRLLDRLRRGQAQREELLRQALDASDAERRRIAATLHDGVVQELAATSFAVSGAAATSRAAGHGELADTLDEAAVGVRTGIGGLRSLLVDIYPPTLAETGLVPALRDLADGLQTRDISVRTVLPDATDRTLDRDTERLVFQVAQECLRNAARHAQATEVRLTFTTDAHAVTLEVADDGVGFDVDAALAHPEEGHFGLRLLIDAAERHGAALLVASTHDAGTHWRLEVPR
ncbi:sensor histidine kinase [Aeromicrobium endophyticum]|uniref:Integral membrane sensor signal transduction histidine kinase n=1 Tax=Aeromicrobium endophyticum TaxID=2292704 RepID=A0A371NZ46_9ACTN|nr:ATP-binding protein [Aeromicrobium endophyticum]REK68962.1 integral membrane sensor signal transduction histidine kinase [Aeromicrobium endophyticum]